MLRYSSTRHRPPVLDPSTMSDDRPSPIGSPTSPTSAPSSSESSQTELGAGEQNDVPQTPRHRRGRSEPHNAFSPITSPQLPSPMALNFFRLGIGTSPLSPFQRQFSSNFSNPSMSPSVTREGTAEADDVLSEGGSGNHGPPSDEDSNEDDNLTEDSKDVLVDRLNDLLKRLSSANLGGANITSLHAKVDEMEKVLASDHHHKPTRPDRVRQRPSILQLASPLPIVRTETGPQTPEQQGHPADYWGFTRTPPRRQPGPPISDVFTDTPDSIANEPSVPDDDTEHQEESNVPKLSSADADRLVAEAEKLCLELNTVVKNLQDRREESDHIHEMLVDRAEAAAARILELNDYVSAVEDELAANKSDLEHLRLQLRALEVLCYEYVPPDADRDLLQSIENWKSDYTQIKMKMASRRRERNPMSAAGSPSVSGVVSPSTSVLLERAGLY